MMDAATGRRAERDDLHRSVSAARWLTLGGGGAALAATIAVATIEGLTFAQRSLSAHVAMETAATIIAGLAAVLAFGRARRTGAIPDILLVATLTLLALVNLLFSLVPALIGGSPGQFATWAPLVGRVLGAVGFLAAAFAPERRAPDAGRDTWRALFASVACVGLIAISVTLLGDVLAEGVDVEAAPEASGRPDLSSPALLLVVQILTMATYALAAVGFLRQVGRGEGRGAWLPLAMALAAVSRLNYFLYPSLYSEYVYVGDYLRVASYLAIMVATAEEILGYERRLAEAAVIEERRRMARELHDGLTQELSYITAQSRRLATREDADPALAHIVGSAERALQESREAISVLTRPSIENVADALGRRATVAARGQAEVEVSAPQRLTVPPRALEALGRIASEATGNAIRHGGARTVRIEVVREKAGLKMRILDDGRGFDVDVPRRSPNGGFGLISMRERAESLGGSFSIRSAPGEGTAVEVWVP